MFFGQNYAFLKVILLDVVFFSLENGAIDSEFCRMVLCKSGSDQQSASNCTSFCCRAFRFLYVFLCFL